MQMHEACKMANVHAPTHALMGMQGPTSPAGVQHDVGLPLGLLRLTDRIIIPLLLGSCFGDCHVVRILLQAGCGHGRHLGEVGGRCMRVLIGV